MKNKLLVLLATVAVLTLTGCQSTGQTNDALPTSTNAPTSVTEPTLEPASTPVPTITEAPTEAPTVAPTQEPTQVSTEAPTSMTIEMPTEAPTVMPTQVPTEVPTEAPTSTPVPTEVPTSTPVPTEIPAEIPTDLQSIAALCKIGTEDGDFSNSLTIYEGDLDFPTLKVYGPDNIDLSQYNIRWGLSDTGIVNAIIDGEIKPAGIGTVVVTARLIDPDTGEKAKVGSVTITVELAETIQVPTGDLYKATHEDFMVTLRGDGTVLISEYTTYEHKEVLLPTVYKGMPIVEVTYGFTMLNVTRVVIPSGYIKVGDCCFATCWELRSIELPDTLEYIGEWAFNDCPLLKEIVIPSSVTYIHDKAFDEGVIIIAEPGSYAEQWAKDNGYTVK